MSSASWFAAVAISAALATVAAICRAGAATGETFLVPIADVASFLGTTLVVVAGVPAARNALSGGKSGEKPPIKAESPASDVVEAEAAIEVGIIPCGAGCIWELTVDGSAERGWLPKPLVPMVGVLACGVCSGTLGGNGVGMKVIIGSS